MVAMLVKCALNSNKSQTVSPAKHPHNITPPPPCFMVGTTHAEIICTYNILSRVLMIIEDEQFISCKPTNVNELKQFYTQEPAKIPPQRCERLINKYRKHLVEIVAAKGGTTRS